MENQNSVSQEPSVEAEGRGTPPEKKKFFASLSRKKKVIIVIVAVLLLAGITSRWSTFGSSRGFYRELSFMGTGDVVLAAKDFEPRGIVFADNVAVAFDGYKTTYDALMKEAAKKGADAIINVNISSTGMFFNRKWSGSALAVKYLDTLPEGYPVIQSDDSVDAALLMHGGWLGGNWF